MDAIERENTALLVYESAMARMEREHDKERKTLKTTIVILSVCLFVAICGLIGMFIYESQWIDEETTVEQEAEWDSGNVILNGTGEVTVNGASEAEDYEP